MTALLGINQQSMCDIEQFHVKRRKHTGKTTFQILPLLSKKPYLTRTLQLIVFSLNNHHILLSPSIANLHTL